MKNRNLLAGLLALLAVSSVVCSCGDTASTPDNGTQALSNETADAVTTEAVPTRPPVGLPEGLDFGGEEFHTIALEWQGYRYYFFAEEENGDVMNDAIYKRKSAVEDALNVKLTYEYTDANGDVSTTATAVKKSVSAGDDIYQQALIHCISGVSMMASGGYLYNLDTLPNIDMNAEWWNHAQMDTLRLGANTYYAVNDFMLPCPYIVYFNKELVSNLDFDNPYQLVYDGKWTLDAMAKMMREVVADLDGDGKMTYEADRFAMTSDEASKYTSFLAGADQPLTQRGSDGHSVLALNTEKTQGIIELFADLVNQNVFYFPQKGEYGDDQLTINSGRLLFQLAALSKAELMRDYTVDFGFLPYPKYDEAQESYHSLDWGGLMCIPTTIRNPEMVGAVTELLAYESANDVIPTYYSMVLTGKLARDEDAEKMLDLIFDTVCYEIGVNYFGFEAGFSSLYNPIWNLPLTTKKSDFASFYAKQEKNAQKTMDKFYEALENAENA
ncbi:MAG: hypothetical protein MJ175_04425 [Clostridia bacterium]|nr:hypothetical protein [Clostridia bacterium]